MTTKRKPTPEEVKKVADKVWQLWQQEQRRERDRKPAKR